MKVDSVSAIIPVHNGASFIGAAITSVLAQTRPVEEIIVVDDGSEDESAQIIEQFREKVIFLRQDWQGGSSACNAAIAAADGDWLAFLDHDDEWLPYKTARQLAAVAGKPEVALIYSDVEVFGDINKPRRFGADSILRGRIFKELLQFNPITPSATMARREAVLAVGGFDNSLLSARDLDLFLRLAARGEVEFISEALARYRMHDGNISKNRFLALSDLYRILLQAREYAPEEYREVWPQVRRLLAETSFELGRMCLEEREYEEARMWLGRCLNYPDERVCAFSYLLATFLPPFLGEKLRRMKRQITRLRVA